MERLLVHLPNWLGDALMARPALHAVRATWPAARITAIAPPGLLALLGEERIFDLGVAYDAATRAGAAAAARAARPDAALVLPPSFSSAWLAWRSGARTRVGFAGEGRSLLLTRAPERASRGDRHLSREYLDLAAELGATEPPAPPGRMALPAAALAQADAALAAVGMAHDARIALLGPGALYGPAKRWAAGRFAALGRTLAERGFAVLACGTGAEREACEEVAIACGGHSLAGATSLAAQAGVCARAALAVCNDSGLAHLAAACGAPTIALFGSTSSAWTAPLGARVRVVQHAPVCAPCFQRTCRIGYRCLEGIEVSRVARACEALAA